jgi:hypothetical protein
MGEEDGVVRIIKAYTNLNKASTIRKDRKKSVVLKTVEVFTPGVTLSLRRGLTGSAEAD